MAGTSTVHVVFNRFPEVERRYRYGIPDAVEKATQDVQNTVVANITSERIIDTGAYRGGWHKTGSGTEWETRNPYEYGIYHEYGTVNMPNARPHIIPAVDSVRPEFIAAIRRVLSI